MAGNRGNAPFRGAASQGRGQSGAVEGMKVEKRGHSLHLLSSFANFDMDEAMILCLLLFFFPLILKRGDGEG